MFGAREHNMVWRIANATAMDCFIRCIRNGATAFARVIPLFTKEIFHFVAGWSGAASGRSEIIRTQILVGEKNLSPFTNAVRTQPRQTALLDGRVDGQMKIPNANPRIRDGTLH